MRNSPNDTNQRVLFALSEGEVTKKDLAQKLGLPRRTVFSAVRRLKERGLVKERPSIRDTRQSWHSLTDQGRAILGAA